MKIRTFIVTSTVVAALIVGCTWGTYDGSYTGGPPDGSNNGSGFAGAMIDPAGGMLTSTDGILTIDIPAGAVTSQFQLTIQLQTGAPGVGPSYSVGPLSMQFLKPIGVLFHETLSMLGPQTAYSVTSGSQPVLLGGTTSDDRGPVIFGITDQLGQFGVILTNTVASSAGCNGNGGASQDTCGACAKNACAMQNGQSLSTSNGPGSPASMLCLCVIPSRGDGIVQAFEGCAAMKSGATKCMASNDMPVDGTPSTPGSVACGGTLLCSRASSEGCCIVAPNPPFCSMGSGCTGLLGQCDEAADCPGPASTAACCGSASGASCSGSNSCNGPGQFQYCRTNSECPSHNCVVTKSGQCTIETCSGMTPPGWPPAGCM